MAGKSKLFSAVSLAFAFLAVVAAVYPAQGQNAISVKSSVDKSKISQDQSLTLKVEISGDFNASPEVTLPDLNKDFDVLSSVQSQSLSIEGNKQSRQLDFIYVLAAKAVGKFTIGEIQVKMGKQVFKTQSIDVEVTPSLHPNLPPPESTEPPEEEPQAGQYVI